MERVIPGSERRPGVRKEDRPAEGVEEVEGHPCPAAGAAVVVEAAASSKLPEYALTRYRYSLTAVRNRVYAR